MNLEQILQNAEITEFEDGDILYVVRPGAGAQDRAIRRENIITSIVDTDNEKRAVNGKAVGDYFNQFFTTEGEPWPDE